MNIFLRQTVKTVSGASFDVNNVKVEISAKTTLRACAVRVTAGKPMTKRIPTFRSLGLVTPGRSRRRAYRRSQIATPGLTTSDVHAYGPSRLPASTSTW